MPFYVGIEVKRFSPMIETLLAFAFCCGRASSRQMLANTDLRLPNATSVLFERNLLNCDIASLTPL
jgi:hypothetical protein